MSTRTKSRRKKVGAAKKKKVTTTPKTTNNVKEAQLLDIIDNQPIETKIQTQTKSKITLGLSVTSKNQLLSKASLTPEAALARIQTPMYPVIEEGLREDLKTSLPGKWEEVERNPRLFEAFKQIVSFLELPRDVTKDNSALVWNVQHLYDSLSLSTHNLVKGRNSMMTEGLLKRVEFHPWSKAENRTHVQIPFPEPSKHHLRTLTQVMEGIQWFAGSSEELESSYLLIQAPTFYECLVKGAVAAGLCSYQIPRSDIRSRETERFYLQALGELHIQEEILNELLSSISIVQKTGTRYLPEEKNNNSGPKDENLEDMEEIMLQKLMRNPLSFENEMEKGNVSKPMDGKKLLASLKPESET